MRRELVCHGLSIALVSACGFPQAPAYPRKEDGFSGPQTVNRPGLPGDAPQPLTLQPGDLLTIELASEPSRTLENIGVDATGQVHVPLAGDVVVGGLGLSEAEAKLEAALRRFDKFVEVTVQVSDPRGQRATVLGAVTTQGPVVLLPGARVSDAIASAGGPLVSTAEDAIPIPLGDLHGAVVTRAGKPLPISVAKALEGDPLHNVYVRPGDHIYVPPALGSNISVLGQVGGPRVFPYQSGMRLTQALAIAGGVTVGADKSDIRVIRGSLEKPRVYEASLAAVVDGDSHDVMLQPGDIIFVTDDPIEDIGEVLGVVSPLLTLGITTALLVTTLEQGEAAAPP
jgi:protein involved in polysaccharide export with SLBB domain